MRGLPMGLHRHTSNNDAEFKDYVDAVRPPFVKFLDPGPGDEELAAWCVARGVAVIGRVYFEDQYLGAGGGRQIRDVCAAARAVPSIRYWELHNEAWQGGDEMSRYEDLSIEFMRQMELMNRIAVIGCFSTGQPEITEWYRFANALTMAAERGHLVAFHEYSAPLMWYGVGPYEWGKPFPGPAPVPNAANLGWWTLRYRRHVREWRRLGIPVPKLVITEAGNDDMWPRPGPQGKGWRDFTGLDWVKQYGDYASQLAWYAQELLCDPFVVGWVDFGWATADPAWLSFDLSQTPDMLRRVKDVMVRLRSGSTPPPPIPPAPAKELPWPATAVMPGETWWKHIAKRVYGSEAWPVTNRLLQANRGVQLMPSIIVFLPGFRVVRDPKSQSFAPHAGSTFPCTECRAGDTLQAIATRMGITRRELAAANPWLRDGSLAPGTAIVVPGYRLDKV